MTNHGGDSQSVLNSVLCALSVLSVLSVVAMCVTGFAERPYSATPASLPLGLAFDDPCQEGAEPEQQHRTQR